MQQQVATFDEVTNFLANTINHTNGIFSLDGIYILDCDKNKIRLTDSKQNPHDLVLYCNNINDREAYILNPFSEGLGMSGDKKLFYDTIISQSCCSIPLIKIMSGILNFMLSEEIKEEQIPIKKSTKFKSKKEKELDEDIDDSKSINDLKLNQALSDISPLVDETTLKDFYKISKESSKFFNIKYLNKMKKAIVVCNIFDDEIKSKYRKQTIEALQKLFYKIFEIDDIKNIYVETDSVLCPNLEAVFSLFVKVQEKFKNYLSYFIETEQNISDWNSRLDYFKSALNYIAPLYRRAHNLVPAASLIIDDNSSKAQINKSNDSLRLGPKMNKGAFISPWEQKRSYIETNSVFDNKMSTVFSSPFKV